MRVFSKIDESDVELLNSEDKGYVSSPQSLKPYRDRLEGLRQAYNNRITLIRILTISSLIGIGLMVWFLYRASQINHQLNNYKYAYKYGLAPEEVEEVRKLMSQAKTAAATAST